MVTGAMVLAPGRLREQTSTLRPAWVIQQEKLKSIFLSNLSMFSVPYCPGKVCCGNLLCPFSSRQTQFSLWQWRSLPTVGFLPTFSGPSNGEWEFLGNTGLYCGDFCFSVRSRSGSCRERILVPGNGSRVQFTVGRPLLLPRESWHWKEVESGGNWMCHCKL